MSFTPSGTVYLMSVPFDNTYEHTIDFDSADQQLAWFQARTLLTFDDYLYQRQDYAPLKVRANLEQMYGINYAVFQNYSNGKWVFAFINEKRYKNENMTELTLEIDVFQTFIWQTSIYDSFIEREHQDRWTADHYPIYSLTPENLTLGDEYIQEQEQTIATSNVYFLVVTSKPLDGSTGVPVRIQSYPTPFFYYIVENNASDGFLSVQGLCQLIDEHPEVLSISYVPFLPFTLAGSHAVTVTVGGTGVMVYNINQNVMATVDLGTFDPFAGRPTPVSFGKNYPRDPKFESKLLTAPYCYTLLTDYQTDPMVIKHEYLDIPGDVSVKATVGLSHNPKTRYYIGSGYKGDSSGRIFNMTNATVNDLPLKTNEYYNYMLSHKAQLITGMATSVLSAGGAIAGGILTGGIGLVAGAGVAGNAIMGIGQQLAMLHDLKQVPDSVRNWGNNVDFFLAYGDCSLRALRYSVTDTIKKLLADYFSLYGYKCMEVKTPDLRSRYYYNYIKTIGANIQGNYDMQYLNKMKEIFNNGVTIWHDRPDVTPLSYGFDNVEMSLI